ncbi:probable methylmalonate-semialdehyde dehydrogenase [acylating], mitochondrial isoform X2 [Argiope bruennichi]|uniref:probable methylmalonate-semialdehyde dehydrogenase [acylating], mitochondrial isoform X2 n=1 Tax=Argiope bruennichi TaxID=94029 RepID=UPI0024947A43|nr:probable methylmalonate-semialdehyde dehydrogenase [acylating], mitochondrial isoform X2 [Argiope bruennichi]
MISFWGKYVYERGSKNVKRVQCNMLVGAAGQHCMALSTAVFVGESPNGFQILQKVESEIKEGAKLLLDGRGIVVPGFEKGNFVGPTILFDVKVLESSCLTSIFLTFLYNIYSTHVSMIS